MTRRADHLLLLFFLICVFCPCLTVQANPQSKAKQCIFLRSKTTSESEALGLSGMPAYVNFPDGSQKIGIYISSNKTDSPATHMGLLPGCVLVAIGNTVTQSPTDVDNILKNRPSGSYYFTLVKLVSGVPHLVTSSTSVVNLSQSVAGAGSTANRAAQDKTPLSALEKYILGVINADRNNNGHLPPLADNQKLAQVARQQAEFLLSAGGRLDHYDFQHKSPLDRAHAVGVHGTIGENLSMKMRGGKKDSELLQSAEADMMAEPASDPDNQRGHILSHELKSVGIGMARNDRMLVVVEDFSDSP